ncbi:MAG: protein translocase subunit SecD [Rubricoccaceae bacterium]
MQGFGFKLFAVAALILLSFWYLFPTVQNYRLSRELGAMDPEARAAYEQDNYARIQRVRERTLNLGLDLQGGMHVTLEVGTGELLRELAGGRNDDVFDRALARAMQEAQTSREDFVTLFTRALEAEQPGTRLARYFRNANAGITARSSNADVEAYLREEVSDALSRAVEIIRQRVDRFGVTEPSIQQQGASRIAVELPGVDDPQRVRDLLRGTAQLRFHLTPDAAEVQQTYARIFQFYQNQGQNGQTAPAAPADTAQVAAAGADTAATGIDVARLAGAEPAATPAPTATGRTFAEMVQPVQTSAPIFGQVAATDTAAVRALLQAPGAAALIPPGMRLLFAARPDGQTADGRNVYSLIGVRARAELEGDVVTDARPAFDPITNAPQVSLTMNSEGATRWAQITGANIGRPVAIVLDGLVYTYPTIRSRIAGGRTQIDGVSRAEAQDIVTILKSGALPAPVQIIEERTVGPSLGAASIRAGTISLVIGFAAVALFMAFYYQVAGVVAVVTLILNVLFVFGILAAFRATLTLPGMAGIVLTIGMAVDANVLIFERIREEMATGKTMKAAVEGGFSKALSAIADANITTFLIGVILYSFGVGPIQGFAVTLMAGILTSLFTALVVTRLMIDYLVRERGARVAFG